MTEATGSGAKCRALRVDGQPCRAPMVGEDGFCFTHSPSRAQARAQARRRGGKASAAIERTRRLAPASLIDVYGELEAALGEVHSGALAPPRAQAMAALARAMVTVLQAGEHEERIRDLESLLGEVSNVG